MTNGAEALPYHVARPAPFESVGTINTKKLKCLFAYINNQNFNSKQIFQVKN